MNGRKLILISASLLFIGAHFTMAAGGAVLPSSDQPMGFSLADLAEDTAVYNTGVFSGSPATPAPPNIPFEVLEGDTVVGPNTYLYLPIFFADDSAPADPAFPASVSSQSADAAYLDNLVLSGFGVSAFLTQVDGQTTVLDDSYITGVTTAPLLDGTPQGSQYIVSAAVISPLTTLGDHTVSFGGIIDGEPVVFGSSTVTVVPEPATVTGLLMVSCAGLIRRRSKV